MTFEEDFPSLKDKIQIIGLEDFDKFERPIMHHWEGYLESDIKKHCLDKQKVKEKMIGLILGLRLRNANNVDFELNIQHMEDELGL